MSPARLITGRHMTVRREGLSCAHSRAALFFWEGVMWFKLKRWIWEWGCYPSQHVHRETERRLVQYPLGHYPDVLFPNPLGGIVVEWCRRCRWVR